MARFSSSHPSPRKQAQKVLPQAYQRLRSLIENSPLAVIEWDREFRIQRWSPQAEVIFGWKAEEVVGKRPDEWHPALPLAPFDKRGETAG